MSQQVYAQLLNWGSPWQTSVGTALSTATTATISPQTSNSQNFGIQPSFLYLGALIRVTARGLLTTTSTSANLTVFLAAGATPTTIATTAAMATGTTILTGLQWKLSAFVRVTAISNSGNTVLTQGEMQIPTTTVPAIGTANATIAGLPSASGETAAAVDTTSTMALFLRATLAAGTVYPTIQCTEFGIESVY
jgi:hypothetical protein